jgi:NitT/TauT family transport system ATP-binding protein
VVSIRAEDISKIYPGGPGQPQVLALDRVSTNVEEGEFVCLIGPSGCGKTTLLHMIAGFTFPSLGQLLYKGKPITGPRYY